MEKSLPHRKVFKVKLFNFLLMIPPEKFSLIYFHSKKTVISDLFQIMSDIPPSVEKFHQKSPIPLVESCSRRKFSHEEFLPQKFLSWRISPALNTPPPPWKKTFRQFQLCWKFPPIRNTMRKQWINILTYSPLLRGRGNYWWMILNLMNFYIFLIWIKIRFFWFIYCY